MKCIKPIIFVLYFFVFTMGLCFGQKEKDSVVRKERRVHFKIFFSPDLCYRSINSDVVGIKNRLSQSSTILAYNSNQEKTSFGFQFGFLTDIKLTRNLILTTGLTFEKISYKTKQIDTVFALSMDGGPFQYGSIINDMSVKYKYFYLSLPLELIYQIRHKKTSFYPGFGIALDYLIKYKREIHFTSNHWWLNGGDEQEEKYKENPFFVSIYISTGIGFQINKKIMLVIEPYFKYKLKRIGHINSENITNQIMYNTSWQVYHGPPEPNLYSIGLSVGLKI